ncbi:UNVERIFIED_CONTAM: hypothetical protein HDU68_003005 [Siphonaria sp. JEL0065]|nr:hypothetical protein HDU68_003005 [Siphonaria sp. JEL0065]
MCIQDKNGICLGLPLCGYDQNLAAYDQNVAEATFFCDGMLLQQNEGVIPSGSMFPRNTSFAATLAVSPTGGVCDGFPVTTSQCGVGDICLWLISSTSATCIRTLSTLPDQITNTDSSNPTCVPEPSGVCLGAWICFLGNNGVEPVYFCDGALVSQHGFNTTLPFHHPLSILSSPSSGGLDVGGKLDVGGGLNVGMIVGIAAGLLAIIAVVFVGYVSYVKKAKSKKQQDVQNQSPRKMLHDAGYGTDLLPLSTSFVGKSSSSSASLVGENTATPVSVRSVQELPPAKDQEVSFVSNRLPLLSNNTGNRSSIFDSPSNLSSSALSNSAGNRSSTCGPPSSNNRSSTFDPPSIPSSASSNNAVNRLGLPSSDSRPVSNIYSGRTASAPSTAVSCSIPSFTPGQDVHPQSNVYSRRTSSYDAPNGLSSPVSSSITSSTSGQASRPLSTDFSRRTRSVPSSTISSPIPSSAPSIASSSIPPNSNREQTTSQRSIVSASGTASGLTVGTTNPREPQPSVTENLVESPTTTPTISAPPTQPTIAPPSAAAINAAIAMKARFSKLETAVQSVPGFYRTLNDHIATTEYELSFEKDVRVYVTSKPDQEGWCNALIAGDAGLVHHTKLGPIG